jgi:hypothetical protein
MLTSVVPNQFGIYSSAGKYEPLPYADDWDVLTKCMLRYTCGGRFGSLDHEDIDAKTYASWGVDYLSSFVIIFVWKFAYSSVCRQSTTIATTRAAPAHHLSRMSGTTT